MPRKSENSKKAGRVPDAEFMAQVEKQMADLAEKNKELQEQIEEMASKKPVENHSSQGR